MYKIWSNTKNWQNLANSFVLRDETISHFSKFRTKRNENENFDNWPKKYRRILPETILPWLSEDHTGIYKFSEKIIDGIFATENTISGSVIRPDDTIFENCNHIGTYIVEF